MTSSLAKIDIAYAEEVGQLLMQAKVIACRYYALTGKPLGISGEVAEFEAMRLLGLQLSIVREPSIDAILETEGTTTKFQIKGRAVVPTRRYIGRVSQIKLEPKCDAVLLALLDKTNFEVLEIWRATYDAVRLRLISPGSKARNERGSLGISQFKSIATRVWPQ